MLCFSDEAMARVLIAGTAIKPDEQKAWLEGLAARFEKARRTELSPSARYTQRYRARRKAGQLVLQNIVVDEVTLVTGLVQLRLLDPLRADDRKALAAAAGRALEAICEASHQDGEPRDTIRLGLCISALRKRKPSESRPSTRSTSTSHADD